MTRYAVPGPPVQLPHGHVSAADVLQQHGGVAVRAVIDDARPTAGPQDPHRLAERLWPTAGLPDVAERQAADHQVERRGHKREDGRVRVQPYGKRPGAGDQLRSTARATPPASAQTSPFCASAAGPLTERNPRAEHFGGSARVLPELLHHSAFGERATACSVSGCSRSHGPGVWSRGAQETAVSASVDCLRCSLALRALKTNSAYS